MKELALLSGFCTVSVMDPEYFHELNIFCPMFVRWTADIRNNAGKVHLRWGHWTFLPQLVDFVQFVHRRVGVYYSFAHPAHQ